MKKHGHATSRSRRRSSSRIEICKGLAYAHELTRSATASPLHIVHRDMSPPNVLITKYGEVKIVDFGLAKANSPAREERARHHQGQVLVPLARSGDGARRRRAHRHLRRRDHPLGAARGAAPLPRRHRLPDGEEGAAGADPVDLADQQKRAARARDASSTRRSRASRLQRYTTARDLGRELTLFLFKHGQAGERVRHRVARHRRDERSRAEKPAARLASSTS